MESSAAAKDLAQALREDRLVVLVGPGASAVSVDSSGRKYPGLPTPDEFVKRLSNNSYVSDDMSFTTACDAIVNREGRARLEDTLGARYRVPTTFDLPPAHRILSWLPFSTYLTFNYDEFLERSLDREGRPFSAVVEDRDVSRIKRGYTVVIKCHGCISRPHTLVATSSDLEHVAEKRPLVRELLSVLTASRTLLVVGHGLEDRELVALVNEVVVPLGEYRPSVVILRESDKPAWLPGLSLPHEVIADGLSEFLNRLLHQYRLLGGQRDASFFDEAWVASAFFAALRKAAVLPSETQVIDAFLSHFYEELGARNEVESVVSDASAAVDAALRDRLNYTALRRTWQALLDDLTIADGDVARAEEIVRRLIDDREALKSKFRNAAHDIVAKGQRLLVYSQSQRVVQVLLGAPQAVQRSCEIFVAECRPKSPNPYQDAAAICAQLADSQYSLTVCPDVVAVNLIATGQISRVLMGTHAIYVGKNGEPYAFVNTCGSLAIALAAERFGVEVIVIGERLKVETVEAADAKEHMDVHQENDLLEGVLVGVTDLQTKRERVSHTNIGYDLVQVGPLTRVIIPDAVED